MPKIIKTFTQIKAAGTKPKIIREYVGRVHTQTSQMSLARMSSPEGWKEPGQKPEFDEYTYVLEGTLVIETKGGEALKVKKDEAVLVSKGEWVRYSTPHVGGAEYIAICLPAFSPDTVHRDAE